MIVAGRRSRDGYYFPIRHYETSGTTASAMAYKTRSLCAGRHTTPIRGTRSPCCARAVKRPGSRAAE